MSTQPVEGRRVPTDTFEARLAMARFHAGNLSAAEAALRVGVSGQAWRNWEAGTSPGAKKPAMLAFIAEQLGVDEEWLEKGGPLREPESPHPGGPGRGDLEAVRHQGLEPRTRCFAADSEFESLSLAA